MDEMKLEVYIIWLINVTSSCFFGELHALHDHTRSLLSVIWYPPHSVAAAAGILRFLHRFLDGFLHAKCVSSLARREVLKALEMCR
jgi:hypothetical protein